MVGLATAQYGAAPSNGYGAPGGRAPSSAYGAPGEDDPIAVLAESIPGGGVPGEDFPVLSEVPDTGFACEDIGIPGYFADTAPEAGCQVFHICQDRGNRFQIDSFLCPNGTIFNQQYFVCDWWFNFDCSTAEDFYSLNEAIGAEEGPYGASGQPENGYGNGNGNGNGRKNGNGGRNGGRNGYGNGNGNGNGRSNGNGNGNGYGAPAQPQSSYGAPNGNGNGGSNGYGK